MSNRNFIVIDDNELDCYIAERLIKHTGKSESIRTFTEAAEALKYISSSTEETKKTVILLDLLMPLMDGFQFVEAFEKLPEAVRANYTIIALTTSLNKNDIHKIKSFDSVDHFLEKPISPESLLPLLD